MIISYSRGHKIIFFQNNWVYADSLTKITDKRKCKKCNKSPTKEGYDACLGFKQGIKSACCGHGVLTPIMEKE
jgi:hypothetical protein